MFGDTDIPIGGVAGKDGGSGECVGPNGALVVKELLERWDKSL